MLILYALPIVLVFASTLFGNLNNNISKKRFLFFSCFLLVCVASLRHYSGGTPDNANYYGKWILAREADNFFIYFEESWSRIQFEPFRFLFEELGWKFTLFVFSNIFIHPQYLFVLSSLIIFIPVHIFIYKNSSHVVLSLLMFICLGLFLFDMNGMRQGIAMSICLLSYEYIKKRQIIPFILMVFLAASFHKTAYVVLFWYFLSFLRLNVKTIVVFCCSFSFIYLNSRKIVYYFDYWTGREYLDSAVFTTGGYVVIAIYLLSISASLIFYKSVYKQRNMITLFYMLLFSLLFYFLRYFELDAAERICLYFDFSMIILMPFIISKLRKGEKEYLIAVIYLLLIILYIYRLQKGIFPNYSFFFMQS